MSASVPSSLFLICLLSVAQDSCERLSVNETLDTAFPHLHDIEVQNVADAQIEKLQVR
jgi:hypothetical protein